MVAVRLAPDPSTILTTLGIGSAVFILLGSGIVMFVMRYQRRLLEQKARARELEAELQRQVLEAVLRTQEEERRRIARDLHDDVGTTLSALKNLVYGLAGNDELTHEVAHVLDDVVQRVRLISSQLLPATLEKFGLVRALEALAEQLDRLSPTTHVSFSFEPLEAAKINLDKEAQLMLYRVAQELSGNALKHADARALHLALTAQSKEVCLQVEDDGEGFDYQASRFRPPSAQPGGLGLLSLESRVRSLHGSLEIESVPGKGTRARVMVPVSE